MPRTSRHRAVIALAAILAAAPHAPAVAGIKLITLPARERVEIQLDHQAATLVEEERVVPLAAGVNDVVFAWANTSIDKNSLQLRCLNGSDDIRVLSVSYPPGESALTWQVWSKTPTSARVRISYLINALDKTFAYRAVASNDESTLDLRQYILLHNRANEAFGTAGMWAGFGERLERPIGINETKRLLSARFSGVPVRKTYTADLATHGYLDAGKKQLRVPMHYMIRNDAASALGSFALMPGKVRIFQDDGRGTEAFIGEDRTGFVPREEAMSLFLGVARDVVVKRTIERRQQKRKMGQVFDLDVVVKYEIENFKDVPVSLDIAESMQALRSEVLRQTGRRVEWEVGTEGTLRDLDHERSTADRPLFRVTLPPRGADQKADKQVHTLHVLIRNEW